MVWDDGAFRPRLQTKADWRRAGEVVFDVAIFYNAVAGTADVRNPAWYTEVQPPLTRDGILPFTSYVIRKKGKVELGNDACEFCHTRLFVVHGHGAPNRNRMLDRQRLRNCWGYHSYGHFAPHGEYSSSGDSGGQVREFKQMVKAPHGAGLEVILDVVYNHTGEGRAASSTLNNE